LSQAKESIPSLQFLPNKCRATAANQHVVSGDLPVYDAFPHPVYGVMDSVGAAFAIGAVSDAAFHFVRGLVRGVPGRRRPRFPQQRAPRGWHPRFQLVMFSTIECVVARAQGREACDSAAVAATAATFCVAGMRRGAAARYVLYSAAVMAVMAETHRAAVLMEGEKCRHRNQMNSEQPVAPAVLRPQTGGLQGAR
jgi:hypothetical protein